MLNELLNRSTHLVGTLRSNRKLNPGLVVKAKLKKGAASQRQNNIVVFKWKDKRDVLMLSTKHKDNTVVA